MRAYYNEIDRRKVSALKQLIKDGHIHEGDVDDRPIQEVGPRDLEGYTRCHFFAGVGLWDYALDLAGWGSRPVWTGSCPCQPFSSAGRQKGKTDDRHLWPEWLRLIKECSPSTIFGEQVASAIAHGWLDDVYQGLEAEDYAVGAAVLPACSVGAPHRRERLWFVADSEGSNRQGIRPKPGGKQNGFTNNGPLGNAQHKGPQRHTGDGEGVCEQRREQEEQSRSAWSAGVWIDCPDGKQRLAEPGISLLAHGYAERVGLIHAAGDGIVPQVAAKFIQAFEGETR